MEYQLLGKSSLNVSRIAFGCMSLRPEQDNIQLLLDAAIDRGINYFDTADLYDKGANEINIGKALKAKRANIIIASKVGNEWRKDGSGWDWNPTKKYILKAVEESLQRLGTHYIDLYQLHGGTLNDPIEETIEAFELLKKQGKIRFYGISSIRPNVIKEYVRLSNISSVMMQYNILDRRPEEECFELLKTHNIGILVRGSVAGGLLINKPARDYLDSQAPDVAAVSQVIQKISSGERSAAQVAIRFVLQNPFVTSAVIGIRTLEQLDDAVGAIATKKFSDEEMRLLKTLIPVNYYTEHR